MPDKLLSIQQAAKLLGVSTKTLRRWESRGALTPSRTVGNQRRYTLEQVQNFHLTKTSPIPNSVQTPELEPLSSPSLNEIVQASDSSVNQAFELSNPGFSFPLHQVASLVGGGIVTASLAFGALTVTDPYLNQPLRNLSHSVAVLDSRLASQFEEVNTSLGYSSHPESSDEGSDRFFANAQNNGEVLGLREDSTNLLMIVLNWLESLLGSVNQSLYLVREEGTEVDVTLDINQENKALITAYNQTDFDSLSNRVTNIETEVTSLEEITNDLPDFTILNSQYTNLAGEVLTLDTMVKAVDKDYATVKISKSLDVSGSTNLSATSITGTLKVGGGLTTDSSLTIDAGSFVRIGDTTSTPGSATGNNDLFVQGKLETDGAADFGAGASFAGDANFSSKITAGNMSVTHTFGGITVSGNHIVIPGTINLSGIAYTWPSGAGSNGNALLSDGSGGLSWGQAGVNDATYLTLTSNSSLTDERVLTAGGNISFTDGGANGALTISVSSTPTITSLTTPNIYGGSAAGSTLSLAGTSNASPSNAHVYINGFGQGSVGIGTTNPGARLHVAGGSILLDNGQFLQAKRNTSSSIIDILGFASGTDRLVMELGASGSTNGINIENSGGVVVMTVRGRAGVSIGREFGAMTPPDDSLVVEAAIGIGTTNPLQMFQVGVGASASVITNAGFLGVGTSSPLAKLHVNSGDLRVSTGDIILDTTRYVYINGSGTLNLGDSSDNTSISNGALYALSTGNVGIGTTNPTQLFQVGVGASATVATNAGRLGVGTTSPNDPLEVRYDTTGGSSIRISNNNTAGYAGLSIYEGTTQKFGLNAVGSTGSGFVGGVDAVQLWNYRNGPMLFATNNGEDMRLSGAGNLGIGSTSPAYKLDVVSSTTQIRFGSSVADSGGYLISTAAGQAILIGGASWNGSNWVAKSTAAAAIDIESAGSMHFMTNTGLSAGSSFTPTERMRIHTNGNVGIGNTGPLKLLHVGPGNDTPSTGANGIVIQNGGDTALVVRDATNDIEGLVWTGSYGGAGTYLLGTVTNHRAIFRTNNSDVLTLSTGGSVGIGTTNPSDKLNIVHSTNSIGGAVLQNTSTGTSAYSTLYLGNSTSATDSVFFNVGTGNTSYAGARSGGIGNNSNTPFVFVTNATEKVRITADGSLGIGTTSPGSKLSVAGSTGIGLSYATYAAPTDGLIVEGNVGIGTSNPTQLLQVGVGSSASVITNAGFVGVGTTSPDSALHVFSSAGNTARFRDNANGADIYIGGSGVTNISLIRAGAADALGFAANDATHPAMTIQTSGNVGIGTTNPSTALHLSTARTNTLGSGALTLTATDDTGPGWNVRLGTADDGSFNLDRRTGGSWFTGLHIARASGNVGIGFTSPTSRLVVYASTAIEDESVLRISGSATGFSGSNDTNQEHNLVFEGVAFSAGTSVVMRDGAMIGMKKEGTWNEADNGGLGIKAALTFKTQNGSIASSSLLERMRISAAGNVGIGTTGPLAKLAVVKAETTLANVASNVAGNAINIQSDYDGTSYAPGISWSMNNSQPTISNAGIWAIFKGTGSELQFGTSANYSGGNNIAMRITESLNVIISGNCSDAGGGGGCTADYAEAYLRDVNDPMEAGDLLAIEPSSGKVTRATNQKTSLVGVFSEAPGSLIGQRNSSIQLGVGKGVMDELDEDEVPVALTGRVRTKVSTENGPIQAGDYITYSAIPGVAMKATRPGAVVGKALESFSSTGVGKILVFVNVGFADPNGEVLAVTETNTDKLEAFVSGEQMRIGHDENNYLSFSVDATGDVSLTPSGGDVKILGAVTITGGLSIGEGTPIKKHDTNVVVTNLGAPAAVPGCVETPQIAVPGAQVGDTTVPAFNKSMPTDFTINSYVTAPDQVIVRLCQLSGTPVDPDGADGATYRADLWSH